MDRTERFHLIDQMLCNKRSVTRAQFLDALEVSPATFKRDLEYLRDRLAAPIIWDPERRGYRYEAGAALDQFQGGHPRRTAPFVLKGAQKFTGVLRTSLRIQLHGPVYGLQ